jgi:hypothetical protein
MKAQIHRASLAALLAALALAGCSRPAEQAKPASPKAVHAGLSGFHHEFSADIFGYYMPDKDYRAGKFIFRNISIGGLEDFETFEAGKETEKTFAPVMLEFDDTTSETGTNELGTSYYNNAPRVLPKAYRVTKTTLAFVGSDRQLGRVTFTGRIDLSALNAAQNGNNKAVVATGDLSFAGQTFKNVKFTWFGGD